jgi:hypothetical protein
MNATGSILSYRFDNKDKAAKAQIAFFQQGNIKSIN